MNLPTVTGIHLLSIAVSVAVIVLGVGEDITFLIVIGFILLIGGIVFELLMHRCPYCRSYIRSVFYSYCPHCGAQINWEDKFYLMEKDGFKRKD